MESVYKPSEIEKKWADLWEKGHYFTPKIDPKKKPFTIILPLPNANDPMHMGHALFTIQDILVRYHRMLGDPTLWLPGGDHAGIETQYVFEKRLAKEGKSRFDFDRNTLYELIKEFVEKNKDINKEQMKQLGFSLDWSRYHYSLEPSIVEKVLETFKKLYQDGLVYKAERLVHYCTKCGTAFSDLEVKYIEKDDILYYLNYGTIQIATVRPETIFADVAVAVHPNDKRYKGLIGKEAVIPLLNKKIPIISDKAIQIDFGTGALKVTPAHDEVDYEIAQRHNLPTIKSIDLYGRMMNVLDKYQGLKVMKAREAVVSDLENKIIKTEPIHHTVATCYRCGSTIEPMLMPQWYVKTKLLAKLAIEAVKKGKTKIIPKKRFEKMYFDWMENILDWNISRQIVWGPRFPVWYNIEENPMLEVVFLDKKGVRRVGNLQDILNTNAGKDYNFEEIEKGLQQLIVPEPSKFIVSIEKPGDKYMQDTDTFDTWFLSSQWPVNTLKGKPGDFEYFYPTSVLDTLWDILFFWVGRMMMMGLYLTGNVPFTTIHLHARVVDKFGQKMSKSKGNVVNPIELSGKFGVDALRMALVFGTAPASDISISEEKVRGMRNFINKLWNAGRFIQLKSEGSNSALINNSQKNAQSPQVKTFINQLQKEVNQLTKQTTKDIEDFQFGRASDRLYQYIWHSYCDIHLEQAKPFFESKTIDSLLVQQTFFETYLILLQLLHPFIPFVTEELHSLLYPKDSLPLTVSSWPTV
jgi:valyl-tRNA synthetase